MGIRNEGRVFLRRERRARVEHVLPRGLRRQAADLPAVPVNHAEDHHPKLVVSRDEARVLLLAAAADVIREAGREADRGHGELLASRPALVGLAS